MAAKSLVLEGKVALKTPQRFDKDASSKACGSPGLVVRHPQGPRLASSDEAVFRRAFLAMWTSADMGRFAWQDDLTGRIANKFAEERYSPGRATKAVVRAGFS